MSYLCAQETQQIEQIAAAELKWLARAYEKETEELKIRQGMDWKQWERDKRKVGANFFRNRPREQIRFQVTSRIQVENCQFDWLREAANWFKNQMCDVTWLEIENWVH